MNRIERLQTVIAGKQADRIPVAVWRHFSAVDYDPYLLAQTQVDFVNKYDFDFIKMMPFGLYGVVDLGGEVHFFKENAKPVALTWAGVHQVEDYYKIPRVNVLEGVYGQVIKLAHQIGKLTQYQTPYIQTIFSPLTTLHKLVGSRIYDDVRNHPEAVKHALEVVTDVTLDFIKYNIAAGVSGFFFATQEAVKSGFTLEEVREFCEPYDLAVINSYKDKTWFNVLHIHGLDVYFEEYAKYPVNVLNWHDRNTWPSIAEARKISDKPFLCGIRAEHHEVNGELVFDDIVKDGTPETIKAHIREAIAQADGGKKLIIGNGCVVSQRAPEENLRAVREAVEF